MVLFLGQGKKICLAQHGKHLHARCVLFEKNIQCARYFYIQKNPSCAPILPFLCHLYNNGCDGALINIR